MKKGVISKKGVDYRGALMAAVGSNHPVNKNVHMQAHHLVSEEGITISGIGETLKSRGYNVNVINNLVFLPSTPAGACHLRVQLHRGDHIHECDEDFSDDDHPLTYHKLVRKMLIEVESKIDDCDDKSFNSAQKLLNDISEDILMLIAEFKLPLTKVFKAFKPNSRTGCSNSIDVNEHHIKGQECEFLRDHEGQENPMYHSSKSKPTIRIAKTIYELKVGQ